MLISEIKNELAAGKWDEQLYLLSCKDDLRAVKERYKAILDRGLELFGDVDAHLFSAPGRTEVGGNHTDHQLGRVLAASVNMDIVALVVKDEKACTYLADDFNVETVMIDDLAMKEAEKNTSEALIRGTLARFKELGYHIGGFKAYAQSEVLRGSGISSSAAFEVLIGTILSYLYNDGNVDPLEIAKIGQYAENHYFQKPCGLMDQAACSIGGFIAIDFKDLANPKVEKIDFDFAHSGYRLIIVDTKGDHADLSDEYGLMPLEMKAVAQVLGYDVLSKARKEELLANVSKVRHTCGDRAFLRALHFFNETARVLEEAAALKANDFESFNKLVIASGYSSYMYLQNVYVAKDSKQEELAVALALSEELLRGRGSYRVHGGGLAGTIQAFVKEEDVDKYCAFMEKVFGEGSCFRFLIRPYGGYMLV